MAEDFISTREFERTMNSLNEKMDSGFKGVNDRLDQLSPLVLDHEKKIAVLEFQAEQARKTAIAAKESAAQVKQSAAFRATAYGSGASAVVWILFEVAKAIKAAYTGP